VEAYDGPLPKGSRGIEFETDVPPTVAAHRASHAVEPLSRAKLRKGLSAFSEEDVPSEPLAVLSLEPEDLAHRLGLEFQDSFDGRDLLRLSLLRLPSASTRSPGILRGGWDVSFTGFGKFSTSKRAARDGINPRTGERVHIAASRVPKFTAGRWFKEAVGRTR
jgi:hypothetical protein